MHLKRLAAPRSWHIKRKKSRFVTRPLPSGFPMDECIPLSIVCRDMLGIAQTAKEAKRVLVSGAVLVDGVVRRNPKYSVGLMDVLTVPGLKKNFRVTKTGKGRIVLADIKKAESSIKLCKVKRKMIVKGGKTQVCTHDGRNFLLDKKRAKSVKVGSTLVVKLPEQKIVSHIPFDKGMTVFVTSGKHAGDLASVKEIKDDRVVLKTKDATYETLKEYSFVVGKTKSEVTVL
jgi:small subunit ribosomal protein S4e